MEPACAPTLPPVGSRQLPACNYPPRLPAHYLRATPAGDPTGTPVLLYGHFNAGFVILLRTLPPSAIFDYSLPGFMGWIVHLIIFSFDICGGIAIHDSGTYSLSQLFCVAQTAGYLHHRLPEDPCRFWLFTISYIPVLTLVVALLARYVHVSGDLFPLAFHAVFPPRCAGSSYTLRHTAAVPAFA